MNVQSYVRLRFDTLVAVKDLQAVLLMFDPLGFVDGDEHWECYFTHDAWAAGREQIVASLANAGCAEGYAVDIIDRQNWNRVWEESIHPIRVSDRFLVHPSWNVPADDEGCILLVIDPKMSFGTGFHETTRLMLRLLELCPVEDARVLDVGTGTGILAIAAMKLGASEAVGVDIDEWSRQNAEENLGRNDIRENVTFRLGTLDEAEGSFDIILSNITRLDNLDMLPRYAERMRTDGRIALSGYYVDDAADLRSALVSTGFRIETELSENEWAAVLAVRDRR